MFSDNFLVHVRRFHFLGSSYKYLSDPEKSVTEDVRKAQVCPHVRGFESASVSAVACSPVPLISGCTQGGRIGT